MIDPDDAWPPLVMGGVGQEFNGRHMGDGWHPTPPVNPFTALLLANVALDQLDDPTELAGSLASFGVHPDDPSDPAEVADAIATALLAYGGTATLDENPNRVHRPPVLVEPPDAPSVPPCARFTIYEPEWSPLAFTAQECEALVDLLDPPGQRSDDVCRLTHSANPVPAWAAHRLDSAIRWANWAWFGLDIDDALGHEVYAQSYGPGDGYDPHTDWFPSAASRKVSAVALITDPDDHEGGVLHLEAPRSTPVDLTLGAVVVFPAWTVHHVTDITEGTRATAVMFKYGPVLR